MTSKPSGTVTFLFTDIEGSTKLAQQHSKVMPALLARHNEILYQAVKAHDGFVFRVVGDSFAVAFHTAIDGLHAALRAQQMLQKEAWSPVPIRVRMGINTGAAQLKGDSERVEYEGYTTLALTQRIMSAAHGGQILISETVQNLIQEQLPEGTELRDMGEHRLKDIFQAEHLYQVGGIGLLADFPPLKTLDTSRNNLPLQLTSFIGRERELAESTEMLLQTRILTFTGPGGTGKTRLALQVATKQATKFDDGVWLIELASLADSTYIISTIASTFSLREVQGVPLLDIVTDYLRGKQLLLLLDNCEHLIEACAQLTAHFLQACPNMKIIASSREALGISGETVYRVPSLSLPSAQGGVSELMEYESVRLFVERATKAEPHFTLTTDNAAYVMQICQRLDGIPLAIELAAARVRLFTPEQIAARLDDRFKLLTGGSRTALPRQQTLRALIDWSYHTLNETEQAAFRRLAVFSGGWTFEAAESVIGESEAMDGLWGLVNKSLVNVEEQAGNARYRFLETIRQYAMDRLLESGDSANARGRHLEYFMEYAAPAEERLVGAEILSELHVLELEHDNFRSALRWSLEGQPESALKMVASLAGFWLSRGHLREGRSWCQAAVDRAQTLPHDGGEFDRLRVRAFHVLALLSVNQGEHHAGQAAAQEAITLARRSDDRLWLARCLIVYGLASAYSGEIEKAFESFHESELICRQLGNKDELAWVLISLSYITFEVEGEAATQKISAYLDEALAFAKESGSPYTHKSNEMLVLLAFARRDFAEALRLSETVLAYYKEMGDRLNFTGHQSAVAHALRKTGNLEEALRLYRETITAWQELGHRGAVAHQLECFAFLAKARGQAERAVKLISAAAALRELSDSPMTPMEQLECDQEVAELRARMDEKSFALLQAAGRSMTMEQAIAFALDQPDK